MTNPYYQDEYCTIYHGDSAIILPQIGNDAPFDLVITDPPYGMNYQSNYRKEKHAKIANDKRLPIDLINMAIKKAYRASYVFCRWDNLAEMETPKSVLAWVKNNWSMGDLKHEHGRQWEACCFYPTEHHSFINRIPDVILCDKTRNNLHPTEKPVELITKIIQANVCDSLLDPFMGSGATLRAAKDLRKKAVGIELEEKYCEIAAKRLQQEVLALDCN